MTKLPNPCIDVCKFRREGHCIGCSMSKSQKKMFKSLKKSEFKAAFVDMLISQQTAMGKYSHWFPAYVKKCRKRGISPPDVSLD